MCEFPWPPGKAPPFVSKLSPGERIAAAMKWTDECHDFLLQQLRAIIGPDGDLKAAYATWMQPYHDEKERMWENMARRFDEIQRRDQERTTGLHTG